MHHAFASVFLADFSDIKCDHDEFILIRTATRGVKSNYCAAATTRIIALSDALKLELLFSAYELVNNLEHNNWSCYVFVIARELSYCVLKMLSTCAFLFTTVYNLQLLLQQP
jgi:hypothetical protein